MILFRLKWEYPFISKSQFLLLPCWSLLSQVDIYVGAFPIEKKMLFLSTTAATATQEEERQVFHIGKNKQQQHKACYLNELSKKSFSIPISTAWFRWFGNLDSDQHPKSERMALWSHLCCQNALKSLLYWTRNDWISYAFLEHVFSSCFVFQSPIL